MVVCGAVQAQDLVVTLQLFVGRLGAMRHQLLTNIETLGSALQPAADGIALLNSALRKMGEAESRLPLLAADLAHLQVLPFRQPPPYSLAPVRTLSPFSPPSPSCSHSLYIQRNMFSSLCTWIFRGRRLFLSSVLMSYVPGARYRLLSVMLTMLWLRAVNRRVKTRGVGTVERRHGCVFDGLLSQHSVCRTYNAVSCAPFKSWRSVL